MKKTKTADTPEPVDPQDETVVTPPPGIDWMAFASTGFEGVTTDDLGIPFLSIIQSKSPEFDETSPEHETYAIPGCKVGTIYNTLSRAILWSPKTEMPAVLFVPCYYNRTYVEWKPRNAGGGVVRVHKDPAILGECTRDQKGKDVLRNGNIVVTTSSFFGFYLSDEGPSKAMISMTSTQLKKARAWLNIAMSIKVPGPNGSRVTPPLFSHKYALTSIPESNELGSWMGWKIETAGPVTNADLVKSAADFSRQISASQQKLIAGPSHDEIPV